MISNLQYQLRIAGVEDRLPEVLEETARVRADFGYPIMVTPLSQFVGSQAAINVITGERYRQVTDKTIEYALGRHGGDEAVNGMDPDVRDRILDRPRAREIAAYEAPRVTLAQLREHYGRDTPDEDLILMSIVGDDAVDVVGSVRDPRPPAPADGPLLELIRRLAEQDRHAFVSLQQPGLKLTMRKGSPAGSDEA